MRSLSLTRAALLASLLALFAMAGGGAPSDPTPQPAAGPGPVEREGTQDLAVLQKSPRGALEVVTETVPNSRVAARLAELRAVSRVLAADVEGEASTLEDIGVDPYRSRQWALDRLRAEEVWELSRGAGVRVAVVDTGVDASHEDLAGRVTDGWAGFDGAGSRFDPDGHGTHVAGVVAAVAGNGVGVAGLAPAAEVVPVRVLDETGRGQLSDVAAGVLWAVEQSVEVINLSLGSGEDSDVLRAAVDVALDAGVVVVAASGNDGMAGDQLLYPAAYPGVVTVSATTSADTSALFSSTGEHVDLAAPGMGVLSTVPGGYEVRSGTSMAAPFVSASAALLLSAGWDGAAAVGALERSATDLGEAERFGAGLVFPLGVLDPEVEDDGGPGGCLLLCDGEDVWGSPQLDPGEWARPAMVWSSLTPRFPQPGEDVVVSARLLPAGGWPADLSARVEELGEDGELVGVLAEAPAGEDGEVELGFVVEGELRFHVRFVGEGVDTAGFATVVRPSRVSWELGEGREMAPAVPEVSWR